MANFILMFSTDGQQIQEHVQPVPSNSLVVDLLKSDTKYIFSVMSFQGTSGSDPSKSVACTTTIGNSS